MNDESSRLEELLGLKWPTCAMIPAHTMNEVIKHLETVVEANRQLEIFHCERLTSVSSEAI